MHELQRRKADGKRARSRLHPCSTCGTMCGAELEALVGFCDECLEASDPQSFAGYPDDWVMLGGGD